MQSARLETVYRAVSDFISDYESESKKTITTFECIPDDLLDMKVDPNGMTIGELGLHIVQAVEKITTQIGIVFSPSSLELKDVAKADTLIQHYKQTISQLLKSVNEREDKFLDTLVLLYGDKWSVSQTLSVLVKHEIHHRAQILLGLRIFGARIPEIYGPTRK